MPRDQLDLRDKTMTELQELDRLNGLELDLVNFPGGPINPVRDARIIELLADRSQIRAAMVERRRMDIEELRQTHAAFNRFYS